MLADQLLVNGRIYTMDAERPLASALAISGERILAVGDDSSIGPGHSLHDRLAPGGQVLDLGGRCVIPGLTDSHIHLIWYALSLHAVDLVPTTTLDQVLALTAERVEKTERGQWVMGWGWDQERWPERRFPTAADLDTVAPDHPVVLRAKSGHAMVVNSFVLRLAAITAETPDPPGGCIGRDAEGHPNGMLFEGSAIELVAGIMPPPDPEELDELLRTAFVSRDERR